MPVMLALSELVCWQGVASRPNSKSLVISYILNGTLADRFASVCQIRVCDAGGRRIRRPSDRPTLTCDGYYLTLSYGRASGCNFQKYRGIHAYFYDCHVVDGIGWTSDSSNSIYESCTATNCSHGFQGTTCSADNCEAISSGIGGSGNGFAVASAYNCDAINCGSKGFEGVKYCENCTASGTTNDDYAGFVNCVELRYCHASNGEGSGMIGCDYLYDCSASYNGKYGISGSEHVENCQSFYNLQEGFIDIINAIDCIASNNGASGFRRYWNSIGYIAVGCQALNNGADGFAISGSAQNCIATGNTGCGYASTVDLTPGGNTASGNGTDYC